MLVRDFQYAYVPVAEELSGLLFEVGLKNKIGSKEYIIAPAVLTNRKYIEDFASKSFTFFFKRLIRGYSRQLKHFRKTYITQEDLFINGRISMQHANYNITSKHYIDRKEIAKEMVRKGFRVFPRRKRELVNSGKKNDNQTTLVKSKRALQRTPVIKKELHRCNSLIIMWRISESNR